MHKGTKYILAQIFFVDLQSHFLESISRCENVIQFSKVIVPFYTPTSNV